MLLTSQEHEAVVGSGGAESDDAAAMHIEEQQGPKECRRKTQTERRRRREGGRSERETNIEVGWELGPPGGAWAGRGVQPRERERDRGEASMDETNGHYEQKG